jgi:glutamyl-tRNA reductase
MQVGLIGLNHKCADLNLREEILRATKKSLNAAHLSSILDSYVLLITCNRVEIYFASQELSKAHTFLLNVLRQEIKVSFEHKLYSFFRWDCFSHLCRVTAGLDSAVLAETEIQGQVKTAYQEAQKKLPLNSDLHYLFQKSLKVGKDIRNNFFSSKGAPSLEGTVEEIIFDNQKGKRDCSVLFVGASDINLSILKSLKRKAYSNISLCNRTEDKGKNFAMKENVGFIPWHDLSSWKLFDVLILATKSPSFLLEYEESLHSLAPKLILDLSVPRDVDNHFRKISQFELLNMDQVNRLAKNKTYLKKDELKAVDTRINQTIGRFVLSYKRKKDYMLYAESSKKHLVAN